MKVSLRWVSVVCFLLPVQCWAFDWSPDTTRYLSDPSFIPSKGQLESVSSFEYSNTNEDWRYISGVVTQHYFSKKDLYTQNFIYGVTSRLRLNADASFSESKSKDTYTNSSSPTEFESHGFNNPSFGALYRLIEQKKIPFNFDGYFHYTPDIVYNGEEVIGGEFHISRELKSLTVQASAGFNHFSPAKSSFGSYWGYNVGVESQLRLSKRWAINSGVAVNQLTDLSVNNTTSRISYLEKHDGTVTPYATLHFSVIPNRVVLGLRYSHAFIGDATDTGYYKGAWINQSQNMYSALLRVLF